MLAKILGAFSVIALCGLSAWLYASVWVTGGPIAQKLISAADTSIPDTVAQDSWLQLDVSITLLVASLIGIWLTLPKRVKRGTAFVHGLLMFVMPIAITSLTPMVGAYAAIFALWVSIAGIALKFSRRFRWRS